MTPQPPGLFEGFQPGVLTNSTVLSLETEQIISLPRLERLGLGRMPWATWTTSAILMIPEPIRHDHTDLNVVRAQVRRRSDYREEAVK